MRTSRISLFLLLLLLSAACAQADNKLAYPEAYRGWQHIKSMVIFADHPLANPFAGIHHIYANSKAASGYRDGRFTDGSVIVFDLLEANQGGGAVQEGPRKLVGVMVKDAKKYAQTGGWGFEGFAGDSRDQRLVSDGGKSCFDCHTQRKDQDFVFSEARR